VFKNIAKDSVDDLVKSSQSQYLCGVGAIINRPQITTLHQRRDV